MPKMFKHAALAGAAAIAAISMGSAASAHNPMTCTEFANLEGEQQIEAFNGLEPKSVEPVLTNKRPEMHRAGDPNASIADNVFENNQTDLEKITHVLNACSEGKFVLVTDAVTEAMKHH